MTWEELKDPARLYSVVLFVQPDDLARRKADIEELGRYRHIRLVVQPCPFEGIEFLYRVAEELIGHVVSMETDVFWQGIALKPETPKEEFVKVSEQHYNYLCSIVQQDVKAVASARKALEGLAQHFA